MANYAQPQNIKPKLSFISFMVMAFRFAKTKATGASAGPDKFALFDSVVNGHSSSVLLRVFPPTLSIVLLVFFFVLGIRASILFASFFLVLPIPFANVSRMGFPSGDSVFDPGCTVIPSTHIGCMFRTRFLSSHRVILL